MTLAEKIRRAREREVTVAGHVYTIRRPTDEDVQFRKIEPGLGLVKKYVIGWDFKELDLVPGGSPDPVPFDPIAWAEHVADKPAIWEELANEIAASYKDHCAQVEGDAKN